MFSGECSVPLCTGLAVVFYLFGSGVPCLPFHQVAFCSLFSWPQAGHQQEGSRVLEAQLVLPVAFSTPGEAGLKAHSGLLSSSGLACWKVWVFTPHSCSLSLKPLYAGMNSLSHGDLKLFWLNGPVTLLGIFIRISPCQPTFLEFPLW